MAGVLEHQRPFAFELPCRSYAAGWLLPEFSADVLALAVVVERIAEIAATAAIWPIQR